MKNNIFPKKSTTKEQILGTLKAMKAKDAPWQTGKVFAYIYKPSEDVTALINEAYTLYLSENGLDPTAFPSMLVLENEVVRMAADLLNGNEQVVGNFTTGGTESIILAVKTARDYARQHFPHIKSPEIILPHTAHAAFYKACHYLDLRPITVPVDKNTFQAIPELMEKAITPNTILLVGSAPSYAQGVVDPIEDLAAIALKHKLLFHVDACVGGMFLPFAKNLGYNVPKFDFSVEGVTSMSMDIHKFGYAAKGASVILHRNADLRKFQLFAHSGWAGYSIVNTTVLSTKTGGPLAACWATLKYIAAEGYQNIVTQTMEGTQKIIEGVTKIEGLKVLGKPVMNMVAMAADGLSVFRIADEMKKLGWFLQPQLATETSQENIHFSVILPNVPHVDTMLVDLERCVSKIKADADENMLEDGNNGLLTAVMGMLQNADSQTFAQLEQLVGMENGQLPENMELINSLLNALPVAERDFILKEFMNRLYC